MERGITKAAGELFESGKECHKGGGMYAAGGCVFLQASTRAHNLLESSTPQ